MCDWRVWKKSTGCVKRPQKMGSLKGNGISDTTSSPNTGCFLHFHVVSGQHSVSHYDKAGREWHTHTYTCSHSNTCLFLCAPHLFMNTGSKLNSELNSECHITWADHWYIFNIQLFSVASFQWSTCRSPRGRTTQHAWVNWRSLHDSLWHQTSLTASLMSFCVCGRWAITELERSDLLAAIALLPLHWRIHQTAMKISRNSILNKLTCLALLQKQIRYGQSLFLL